MDSPAIRYPKGRITMSEQAKFEGWKQALIEQNEAQYGTEARAKYGNAAVDASNQRVKGMTAAEHAHTEALSKELNAMLATAVQEGDPASPTAQKACDLHRQWLQCYWADGMYSQEAHLQLAEAYCADPRFTSYYESVAAGAAPFLRDALKVYCQ